MSTRTIDSKNLASLKAEPDRPWTKFEPSQIIWGLAPFIAPVLIAAVIVLATPMKGRVGFFIPWLFISIAVIIVWPIFKGGKNYRGELLIQTAIILSSFLFFGSIIWLIASVFKPGFKNIHFNLFIEDGKSVTVDTPLNQGGLLHAILGTIIIVGIATLIAVPFGVLAALYITEVRGRLVPFTRFFIQAMSGVPSIIAGLFIYAALIITQVVAFSGISGALALSILMLPTVARTAEEVLRLVPDDLRAAALSLGGTQTRTIFQVVLPAAKSGLITAVILGVARVAGETAPLLLTAFGGYTTNLNPFHGPMASLPWYVFSQMTIGTDNDVARAWVGALTLLVLVSIFFAAARLLGRKRS